MFECIEASCWSIECPRGFVFERSGFKHRVHPRLFEFCLSLSLPMSLSNPSVSIAHPVPLAPCLPLILSAFPSLCLSATVFSLIRCLEADVTSSPSLSGRLMF